MNHPDVDKITALALGLLEEPQATEVRAHCDECADCGDQLAVSELLTAARPKSLVRQPSVKPATPWGIFAAAASVLLLVGTVGFMLIQARSARLEMLSDEPTERVDRLLGEYLPPDDLYTDEAIRYITAHTSRRFLGGPSNVPRDLAVTEELYRAMDEYDAGDYLAAASRIELADNYPGHMGQILISALYFGGDVDGAEEAAFARLADDLLDETYPAQSAGSFPAAAYFLSRIHFEQDRPDSARRFGRIVADQSMFFTGHAQLMLERELLAQNPAATTFGSHPDVVDDEVLRGVLVDWGRYLYPYDVPDRGYVYRTGVPRAIELFAEGDYLGAIERLQSTAHLRDPYRFSGFAPLLETAAHYAAGQFDEARRLLEEDRIHLQPVRSDGPVLLDYHSHGSYYYLARTYALNGQIDEARVVAAYVSTWEGVFPIAARQLLDELGPAVPEDDSPPRESGR